MSEVRTIAVAADEAEMRLDRWFRRRFPELAHGQLEKLLRTGQVRVDGRRARANLRLATGQKVRVPPLPAGPPPRPKQRVSPVSGKDAAALQAAVLYKDDDLLAIDKPAGLAVQGGTGLDRHLDAMLDALRFEAADRPRLVHRLDRDTSGVLLLARNRAAAAALAAAFRSKTARKLYWAAVVGVPARAEGRIDLPLAKRPGPGGERVFPEEHEEGRRAVTLYKVIDRVGAKASWLALMPVTGRTHQLRAHCVALGTPILGDGRYGGVGAFLPGGPLPRRLHLHARAIELPRGRDRLRIVAPLPNHMAETWRFLGFDADRGTAELDAFPA